MAVRFFLAVAFLLLSVNAFAVDARITLNWTPPTENVDGSPVTDLAGFRVYWRLDDISQYSQSVTINDAFQTTYDLDLLGLENGTSVYIVMTAFDMEMPANESVHSNEVVFGPFLIADETAPGPPAISGEAAITNCPAGMVCVIGNL